jgi:hypothetical protein
MSKHEEYVSFLIISFFYYMLINFHNRLEMTIQLLEMIIKDNALYNLYILVSLDDMEDKGKTCLPYYYTCYERLIHKLFFTNIFCILLQLGRYYEIY